MSRNGPFLRDGDVAGVRGRVRSICLPKEDGAYVKPPTPWILSCMAAPTSPDTVRKARVASTARQVSRLRGWENLRG